MRLPEYASVVQIPQPSCLFWQIDAYSGKLMNILVTASPHVILKNPFLQAGSNQKPKSFSASPSIARARFHRVNIPIQILLKSSYRQFIWGRLWNQEICCLPRMNCLLLVLSTSQMGMLTLWNLPLAVLRPPVLRKLPNFHFIHYELFRSGPSFTLKMALKVSQSQRLYMYKIL